MKNYPDPLGGVVLPARLAEQHQEKFRKEEIKIETHPDVPPMPGTESVGPSLVDLVRETRKAYDLQSELLRDALQTLHLRPVSEGVSGITDANGNLDLRLFVVPMGYVFWATRVTIEDGTHTPASPYSNAAAWLALIRGQVFASGSILDFGPATAGSTIIPSIFSTSKNHAPMLRGGEILTLHIVGAAALANTSIWSRCQGFLEPL